MKVCVLNPNFYRSSGVTVAIRRLYEGAAELPIDWFFVNCQHGSALEIEPISWLRPKDAAERSIHLMSKNPLKIAKALLDLSHFIRVNKIDVVHIHHRRLAWLVGLICKIHGTPIVYTGHLAYGPSKLRFLKHIDQAISISQSVENDMRRSEHPELPITRIANACPTPNSPIAQKRTAKKIVLCVARLEPVKNHKTLISAWAGMVKSHPDAELWLLGEGSLRSSLEAQTNNLGCQNSIKFMGFNEKPQDIVDECDFLVLPSLVEGLPLVVLEAALRGKSTLLSDADGNRDCVPPSARLPTLFPPEDVKALSDLLSLWLSTGSAELRREGEIFCSHWTPLASPPSVAQQHMDVYMKAIEGRKPLPN